MVMLSYFVAAVNWHYLRYGVHLNKMTKLPTELLQKFPTEEHAIRHCNGFWNSIWSGMMIETIIR